MAHLLDFLYIFLQSFIGALTFEGADSSFSLWCFPRAGVFCLTVVLIPGVSCLSLPTPAPLSLLPLVGEFLSVSVWSATLNEISPEYSLEKLMLKLKMQYFGCLMRRTDTFELWCYRRLLRVPWTERRSNQSIVKEINLEYSLEGLVLKLKLPYFGHLMGELTHWKKPWCWERLRAGGEGDYRGWGGWMASLT